MLVPITPPPMTTTEARGGSDGIAADASDVAARGCAKMRRVTRALEALAIHHLDDEAGVRRIGAADPAALAPPVRERLDAYLDRLLDQRNELDSRSAPAWWRDGQPAIFERLAECALGDFADVAAAAAERLADDGSARGGLLLFVRGMADGEDFLACMKVELTPLEDVRWEPGAVDAAEALHEIVIPHVLPRARGLQKAAVLPGPDDAPLWVVDDQTPGAAQYWMRFLGAQARPNPKERLKRVAALASDVLRKDFQNADDEPIARAVAAAASSPTAVLPDRFLTTVAEHAGVSADDVLRRAGDRDPVVVTDRYAISPQAAREARTTYDLGDEVKLTGPRRLLEQRARKRVIDGRTYLQVLVTIEPRVRHS